MFGVLRRKGAEQMSVSDIERIVRERYGEGARGQVAELCCPVDYDPKFLEVIPREVLERDYGCGDPSRHLRAGEVVAALLTVSATP